MTNLHDAAKNGDLATCRILIEHGTDVNAKNDGWTPLHFAASSGYLKICELLIEHGADVNAKNNGGWTPLDIVVDERYLEIYEVLLIKHHAVIDYGGNAFNSNTNTQSTQLPFSVQHFPFD